MSIYPESIRFVSVVLVIFSIFLSKIFAQEESLPVVREAEQMLQYIEATPVPVQQLPQIEKMGASHVGISFQEIWELAQQHSPVLRQKANLIAAAKGGQLQAGLYPNPTMTMIGDNMDLGKEGKYGLAVTQELVTTKKKKWDRTVAGYDVAAAQREYDMECRKLYNDLRIAFAGVLHAQLTLQIERYSERLSNDLLQAALRRQAQGKARPIDVLQFRTTLNESALKIRLAETNQRTVWHQLIALVGRTDWPQQAVRGVLHQGDIQRDWDVTWAMLRAESPELEIACLKVRQAQANLARQRAYRVPNVSANISVAQDIAAERTVPFVGISVPIKVYDKNQGNVCKAKAELAAANREVERIVLSLHSDFAEIFQNYSNARELVETYQQTILPDTFEALRQLNDLYHQGDIDYLELYTQRHAVMETLLRYVNALKEQSVAATLLDGMLLQGTLNR